MEKPERKRSGAEGDKEEEDFHDCTEEPERQNGESEEEFTVLEAEESAADMPVVSEPDMADKRKPEPLSGDEEDPEPAMEDNAAIRDGDAEPVESEWGVPEPVPGEEAHPGIEMDEEALQELEKDMTEDEREVTLSRSQWGKQRLGMCDCDQFIGWQQS